jgi:hypothetical protein
MTFGHSVPVKTKTEQDLFARGRVWNPHAQPPQPWTCARCGEANTDLPHVRPDGPCCEACCRAEDLPPLLTPEQIEQQRLEHEAFRREMEDRHEQACQLREEEYNTQ